MLTIVFGVMGAAVLAITGAAYADGDDEPVKSPDTPEELTDMKLLDSGRTPYYAPAGLAKYFGTAVWWETYTSQGRLYYHVERVHFRGGTADSPCESNPSGIDHWVAASAVVTHEYEDHTVESIPGSSWERTNCYPYGSESGATYQPWTNAAYSDRVLRSTFHVHHADEDNPNFSFSSDMHWIVNSNGAEPEDLATCELNC
ncbi:hypothetical protein ER308_00515 [Egibacter rhizosphaerae]|uniref:Secreted protein n=1 Tax=Egibacter rhizosphaerae TaxID=1670831 RepID=A0A411YAF9_9ACTN|nr:hypothetical protein [Egibacter rhizosphaerae]QBI18203.1 hypothetical protein ER308_00515 [Egibacter rhizosphaerae]